MRILDDRIDAKVMACHLSPKRSPYACAGFIAKVGTNAMSVRIGILIGAVDLDDYSDGGADLYDAMEEMCAAHPDPALPRNPVEAP